MAKKKQPETTEEMLSRLSADSTYEGVDIRREYGKAVSWCQVNHRIATARFFVNWLNRVDKPLPTRISASAMTPIGEVKVIEEERVNWTLDEIIAFVNQHEKEQQGR